MSLTDTDKSDNSRLFPQPNADDENNNPMAHETIGTTYRTVGSGVKQGIVLQQGILEGRDSNNNRNMFFGYEPSINPQRPILRIAKGDIDALDATNDQLIFNSEQNIFKVVDSGVVNIPAFTLNTGGAQYAWNTSGSIAIPHGLTYAPAFLAFESTGADYSIVGKPSIESASPSTGFIQTWAEVASDATNLYIFTRAFGFNINTTALSRTIKYYLLQETAN